MRTCSASRTKALTPPAPGVSGSVRAKSRNVPAYRPFVIHCFAPVIRQPSPSGSARVRSAPASDPASGSVRANAPRCSPAASGGMKRDRCSSVPHVRSGSVTALVCTATVTPTPASARDSSSSTRMYERKSAPAPPYSAGMHTPISPSSASFAKTSRGKRCSRSHSAACGSISCRANSRASPWISFCSGASSKSTARTIVERQVQRLAALGAALAVAAAGSGAALATTEHPVAGGGRARVEQGPQRERQRGGRAAVREERTRHPGAARRPPPDAGARRGVQQHAAVRRPDRRDDGRGRTPSSRPSCSATGRSTPATAPVRRLPRCSS